MGEVTIKIINVNLARLIAGISAIGNLDIEDFKTNMGIAEMLVDLARANSAYNKSMSAIQKKYIIIGSDGKLQSTNGLYDFKTALDKEEYLSQKEKVDNETPPNLKVFRLKASVLEKVKGITANMLANCFELIDQEQKTNNE